MVDTCLCDIYTVRYSHFIIHGQKFKKKLFKYFKFSFLVYFSNLESTRERYLPNYTYMSDVLIHVHFKRGRWRRFLIYISLNIDTLQLKKLERHSTATICVLFETLWH